MDTRIDPLPPRGLFEQKELLLLCVYDTVTKMPQRCVDYFYRVRKMTGLSFTLGHSDKDAPKICVDYFVMVAPPGGFFNFMKMLPNVSFIIKNTAD